MVPQKPGKGLMVPQKPGIGRLDQFSRSRYREPVINSKGEEEESPANQALRGATLMAIGMLAINFARLSMKRVSREMPIISKMWEANTTVASLMRMPDPLPKNVLLRGRLGATGPPVIPLTTQVRQLQPLLGQIDQPNNEMIEIGQKFKKDLRHGQWAKRSDSLGKSGADAFASMKGLAEELDVKRLVFG